MNKSVHIIVVNLVCDEFEDNIARFTNWFQKWVKNIGFKYRNSTILQILIVSLVVPMCS